MTKPLRIDSYAFSRRLIQTHNVCVVYLLVFLLLLQRISKISWIWSLLPNLSLFLISFFSKCVQQLPVLLSLCQMRLGLASLELASDRSINVM